jgi:hypothetical protein
MIEGVQKVRSFRSQSVKLQFNRCVNPLLVKTAHFVSLEFVLLLSTTTVPFHCLQLDTFVAPIRHSYTVRRCLPESRFSFSCSVVVIFCFAVSVNPVKSLSPMGPRSRAAKRSGFAGIVLCVPRPELIKLCQNFCADRLSTSAMFIQVQVHLFPQYINKHNIA